MKSLADAHTWDVVEWPLNTNIISYKWVFKIKKNTAGEIDKYKVQLVACGFTQQYGVDYDEIYAPVARLTSLCLILAITAHHNWDVDVFYFHSVFLNRKLDDNEVIFMELPPGFDTQDHDLVARLCIALYSSKQGTLKWYLCLYGTVKELSFVHMEADWSMFVVNIAHHILILALHVDNCTVTRDSATLIKAFKDEIGSHFWITDLRPISWLLGMKVTHNHTAHTISLSQELYVTDILAKYNFTNTKPVSIPLDPHIQLSEKQSPQMMGKITCMHNIPYWQAVGSLIHLASGTGVTFGPGRDERRLLRLVRGF